MSIRFVAQTDLLRTQARAWRLPLGWRIKEGCNAAFFLQQPSNVDPSARQRGAMSSVTSLHPPKGLEGVVATTSGICYIDGERGVFAYRGIRYPRVWPTIRPSRKPATCCGLDGSRAPTNSRNCTSAWRRSASWIPSIIALLRSAPRSTRCRWMCCAPPSQRSLSTIPKIEQRSRRQRAQSDPPDLAAGHDRGRL